MNTSKLVFPCLLLLYFVTSGSGQERKKLNLGGLVNVIRHWADQLGRNLQTFANNITRRLKVVESFKHTKVVYEDGKKLREEIVDRLRVMMAMKEEAVKNIADKAEYLSLHRKKPIDTSSKYDYYNTDFIENTTYDPFLDQKIRDNFLQQEEQWRCEEQQIKERNASGKGHFPKVHHTCEDVPFFENPKDYYLHLPLDYHPQFYEYVNTNVSALRIATSIYDRDPVILNDVRWSAPLDLVFKKNFRDDPTLAWQYFAGTTGFMRHYPAVKWSEEKYESTYEFRTRSWYLEAISSPKDVIILLDMSGSMWQYKWLIAKFLVNSILDTLGDNDYVNVYLFNNEIHPLVDCFRYTLMQAHEENLRLVRENLDKHLPYYTGDMSKAFEMAFATLARYRKDESRAHCNQMIMLISEGIDYDYKPAELFKTYNRTHNYHTDVRVFTFLIGTSSTDAAQMEWIACANMGYYVNISRESDVPEQTLKYLAVLSRPLNFNFETKPEPIWTSVYADLADRRQCNWLWNKHEGNMQRQLFVDYTRDAYEKYNCIFDHNDHFLLHTDHEYAQYSGIRKYNYMTTVSLPAYDRRPGATTVLGIAAIDVPIENIKMLMMPHRIGVNGYGFILTNNGLLLIHPDHRKEFNLKYSNIMKPTFNRVDLAEVELTNDLNEPRDFNKTLLEIREKIVNHQTGFAQLDVKTHLEDMKRVILSRRHYYYTHIGPFSFSLAIPDGYGFFKISYNKAGEVRPNVKDVNVLRHSSNWYIHPEWMYCKHFGRVPSKFNTSEAELLYFLRGVEQSNWRWHKYCTPSLVNMLLADAKATEWFDNLDNSFDYKNYVNKLQVATVFLATHSGLTRWKSFGKDMVETFDDNKAIDEIWYRRAVDYNFASPQTFLYSVPLEPDDDNFTLVTASQAVFREDDGKKAPAAVVGFQFNHDALTALFQKITQECDSEKCAFSCASPELGCYVLDNNAYVMLGEEAAHVGKFVGEINPDIMQYMVEDGIYSQIRVMDYQAICYIDPPEAKPPAKPSKKSVAPRRSTFLGNVFGVIQWVVGGLVYLINIVIGGKEKDNPCLRAITSEYSKRAINKTLPTPCDNEMWLYILNKSNRSFVNQYDTRDCFWLYIVQPVPNTNLIILVINKKCMFTLKTYPYSPTPVEYKYNMSMPCYIANMNNYTRRQYIQCINKHEEESKLNLKDKKYCGITWKT